jgi:ribosomal protein S18 acetylase RimI-like enzyme
MELMPNDLNIQTQFDIKLSSIHMAILDMVPVSHIEESFNTLGLRECLVTRLNVPEKYRQLGWGTKLLNKCIEYADEHKLVLLLEVAPSGGMNSTQLTAWYCKFGFVGDITGFPAGLMARMPNGL